MNNTVTEIKNTLAGTNDRITEAEEQISELEDRMVEITAEEKNKRIGMKKIEESLRDLWDNIKHTNIRVIGVPEEEEKEKGTEDIFEEITVENSPSMGKEITSHIQEAQRVQYRANPWRNTSRHILIKLTEIKDEERILKVITENHNGKLIELTADLSAETMQARKE